MINLDELKPIIEPLLNDENSVSVIEQIQAIDRPGVSQADLDNLNKEWSDRYRKAFFEGVTNDETGNHDSEEQAEEQAGEEEKVTFDDLFSEEEE